MIVNRKAATEQDYILRQCKRSLSKLTDELKMTDSLLNKNSSLFREDRVLMKKFKNIEQAIRMTIRTIESSHLKSNTLEDR